MNTESGAPIEIRISKWSAGLGGPLVGRAPNCPGGTPLFRGYEPRRRGNQA
jgi:hypothetical protein